MEQEEKQKILDKVTEFLKDKNIKLLSVTTIGITIIFNIIQAVYPNKCQADEKFLKLLNNTALFSNPERANEIASNVLYFSGSVLCIMVSGIVYLKENKIKKQKEQIKKEQFEKQTIIDNISTRFNITHDNITHEPVEGITNIEINSVRETEYPTPINIV